MKKLLIALVTLLALQVSAQEHKKKNHDNKERAMKRMNLSAEEMATLQTKKMTLHLDLSESQQSEVYNLNLKSAEARKAYFKARKAKKESGNTEKPSKEERLKMTNTKLDHQIATKRKMKEILNEEQYAKWEKSQVKRSQKNKKAKKKHAKKSTY